MKVLVLTLGTRGDVQPFAALARELLGAGHDAVVAAPERFAELVGHFGVRFAPLDDGPLRLMDGGSVVADVANGGVRARVNLARKLPALFTRVLDDCWATASTGAGADADVIVHNGQVIGGQHVAEKLQVPAVLGLPLPMYVPTRAFPWPGQAFPGWLPAALNRMTFVGMKAPTLAFGRTVDKWRASLDLPRRRFRHDPTRQPDGRPATVMHAVSRHVLSRPADWPPAATMTGYWFAESSIRDGAGLSADLEAFLAAGDPPIFVGFGSMAGADPARTTDAVISAVEKLGCRAVLATGWGGLVAGRITDNVLVVNEAPYDSVFPRMATVVHHGGAGTTGSAVAAGVPQVICPFVADQPFWGRRMNALGVAPAPVDQRHLNAAILAEAIGQALDDPDIRRRASSLGELVRAEHGTKVAVEVLEQLANRDRNPG